jgi:predicted AlkP superfamily pyrophosphatase or phosphodiesterase
MRRLGFFSQSLRRSGREDLNVIIVSDHGMTESSPERAVVLDDYIEMADVSEAFGRRRVVLIYPRANKKESLLQQLQKVPHARFYAK